MKSALWRATKRAHPTLTDSEIDQLLATSAETERRLTLDGLPQGAAREVANAELFEGASGFEGDEDYGPQR